MRFHCVVFDKSKPKPAWLEPSRFGGEHGEHRARWYNRVWDAQPVWADRDAIRQVYKDAAEMRRWGCDVTVDHIIPLFGEDICGLHIATNLRVIDRVLNAQISNHTYPGAPCEQLEMFDVPAFLRRPPQQRELL